MQDVDRNKQIPDAGLWQDVRQVELAQQRDAVQHNEQDTPEEEEDEVTQVVDAHAGADEVAVMVSLEDTLLTQRAVMAAWGAWPGAVDTGLPGPVGEAAPLHPAVLHGHGHQYGVEG